MYSIRMSIRLIVIIFFCTTLFWISCTKENPPNYPIDSPPVDNPPDSTAFDDGSDLSIRFIHRLPEIDYVWESANPAVEGWPEVGQEVLWRSHIKNWADNERSNVGYAWFFDGVKVDSGSVDIPANEEITVDYPWLWTFDRHVITLQIDPQNEIEEEAEDNNQLSIFTDAITVGFYVEQLFYDTYRYLWDDWLQKRIGQWNDMLERAIFPETPNGVLDRIRIDKISTVPDEALVSPSCESIDDRTIDMVWGFPHDWVDNYETFIIRPNDIQAESTLHHLGHVRYLVDTYGFDVNLQFLNDVIEIQENGMSIIDSPYLPNSPVFQTSFRGLMHAINPANQGNMDRYSAASMNLIAGHRATVGNYAYPVNMGVFLNDLPEENRLTVKDTSGEILKDAAIRIYQSKPWSTGLYAKYFDNEPDLLFTTDENGQVLLGRNPFNTDGPVLHDGTLGSNVVVIVRVEHEGKVGYGFLEVGWFNLAYWRGETELADHEIKVQMISD